MIPPHGIQIQKIGTGIKYASKDAGQVFSTIGQVALVQKGYLSVRVRFVAEGGRNQIIILKIIIVAGVYVSQDRSAACIQI